MEEKDLGLLISKLIKNDNYRDYIQTIISKYTKDINQGIDFENAINILSKKDKKDIIFEVRNYLKNGLSDKTPEVIAHVDLNESIVDRETLNKYYSIVNNIIKTYIDKWNVEPNNIKRFFSNDDKIQKLIDKNDLNDVKNIKVIFKDIIDNITEDDKSVFVAFCKALTALGQKDTEPDNTNAPDDYLFYYLYKDLPSSEVKLIFNRFQSLSYILLDNKSENISLYLGINLNGDVDFGLIYDKQEPIRTLKLNKTNYKWLLTQELKSIRDLKKKIVNINNIDMSILGTIKRDMDNYTPFNCERIKKPIINDRIITYTYSGMKNINEYDDIKKNYIDWVNNKPWGSKILISLKIDNGYLNIHIKLK